MKPSIEGGDKKQEGFLKPNHEEVKKIAGMLGYNEASRGWAKLVFPKDMLDLFKILYQEQCKFEFEVPVSKDARISYVEKLRRSPDESIIFLRIKKIEGENKAKRISLV